MRMLSHDTYMKCHSWTKLSAEDKEHVYQTYTRYRGWRDKGGRWDIGQRAFHLFWRLSVFGGDFWTAGYPPFTRLCVDEIQDVTAVEFVIMLACVGNQKDHLTLCGDTAQQVTSGVAFCFEFICEVIKCRTDISVPHPTQLCCNYRSHSGILGLSVAVLQLLKKFEGAVDSMSRPESCLLAGPTPKLARMDHAQLRDAIGTRDVKLLFLDLNSIKEYEEHPDSVAGAGMTVRAAKGLEWDSVCIVGFFGALGRSGLNAKGLRHIIDQAKTTFRASSYLDLEFALKKLYVATTRCRYKLTFVEFRAGETSAQAVNTAFKWMRENQIAEDLQSTDNIGVASTAQGHLEAGYRLMYHLETAQENEEVSTFQQYVSNAQRNFQLGGDRRMAIAAQLHLDMIVHGRQTRTGLRDNRNDQPLTQQQKQWETRAAALVKKGVTIGLVNPCKKLLKASLLDVQISDLIND